MAKKEGYVGINSIMLFIQHHKIAFASINNISENKNSQTIDYLGVIICEYFIYVNCVNYKTKISVNYSELACAIIYI